MRAMILAAGKGERMRPLTDALPKPLLEVAGKSLLEWHLENLSRAGFREVVINIGHLGQRIPEVIGNGDRWAIRIQYSDETGYPEPLETGGGISRALPLLGRRPFLVINGDIWCDYPLHRLRSNHCDGAHLVLVDNPPHHQQGDFALHAGLVRQFGDSKLTFAGIAVYHPELFQPSNTDRFSVVPLLRNAMDSGQVTGEVYRGRWFDIGTPERLDLLRNQIIADLNTQPPG